MEGEDWLNATPPARAPPRYAASPPRSSSSASSQDLHPARIGITFRPGAAQGRVSRSRAVDQFRRRAALGAKRLAGRMRRVGIEARETPVLHRGDTAAAGDAQAAEAGIAAGSCRVHGLLLGSGAHPATPARDVGPCNAIKSIFVSKCTRPFVRRPLRRAVCARYSRPRRYIATRRHRADRDSLPSIRWSAPTRAPQHFWIGVIFGRIISTPSSWRRSSPACAISESKDRVWSDRRLWGKSSTARLPLSRLMANTGSVRRHRTGAMTAVEIITSREKRRHSSLRASSLRSERLALSQPP